MAKRQVLEPWIIEALRGLGGSGSIADVCARIWEMHEIDLRNLRELLYTWHYDARWAATRLRRERILKAAEVCPRGVWELEILPRNDGDGYAESVSDNSGCSQKNAASVN
jgi:hypothetical protein